MARTVAAAIALAALGALSVHAQTMPPMTGGSCSTCHGADLKGAGPMPALAGHEADYIRKALAEFKAGSRPATVMTRLAKGYSDAEIEGLAAWIATLK